MIDTVNSYLYDAGIMANLVVQLPESFHAELKLYAAQHDAAVSKLVRRWLRAALDAAQGKTVGEVKVMIADDVTRDEASPAAIEPAAATDVVIEPVAPTKGVRF